MAFADGTYRVRRRDLARRLADTSAGLVLLVGHRDEPYTFAANPYPFRQDSSFLYYFGLAQPGLAALIDLETGQTTLVADPQDEDDLLWCARASPASLGQLCGADHVVNEASLRSTLMDARRRGREIHHLPSWRADQTLRLAQLLEVPPESLRASIALIGAVVAQREIKSAEELREIEAAVAVSARMHGLVQNAAMAGTGEAELVGLMQAEAARAGARMAYPPICTRDGHILHHLTYDNILRRGDLLLVDAGAEAASGYASDITRTLCVDHAWSDVQRLMYATVQQAQARCAAEARPGMAMAGLHRLAARIIVEGLAPLGLFRGSADAVVDSGAYALVFPHGLGHQLGLDVHDMEALGEDNVGYDERHGRDTRFGPNHLRLGKPLRAGMVITLEPGIYFIPALWAQWRDQGLHRDLIDADVAGRLMGQAGVRIEDDYVIMKDGARRLGPAIAP